ncbi:alanine racemase [Sandarakinorhabdus sp.]|uniref:alanine racemase n=1 Tax=Sandarakinorhabdus sp. TaxID=1916663 RepID=UPI00286E914C|nr:alanine racemase [Sandarakinorhabdus sp.]
MQPLDAFLARVRPQQTPVLVVRRAALMANLAAMQAACDAGGVRLRAHGKMHKCSALARLQVAGGAVGLCCQTVGEAEVYGAAGIADLLVTAPVPPWGWRRLAALAGASRVSAVVDSEAQLALASAAAVAAGNTMGIHIDVDPGMMRAGVPPAEVGPLMALALALPGLRVDGIQAYCGHHQHLPGGMERRTAALAWSDRLAALVAELGAAGMAPRQVTGGGTGTFAIDIASGVYTELQAGSYALMDVEYADCGGPDGHWPFRPALFVAASIVSARHASHNVCDAGLKAFHTNGPSPRVIVPDGSTWRSMGDEHGAIMPPGDSTEGALVWLQPGHVDPTVALHDAMLVAGEDGTLERWAIDARRFTPPIMVQPGREQR